MAYVDDELAPEARAEVEARIAAEPSLARQVVEYRKLEVLGRALAPPEPEDYEWRRIEEDGVHRAALGLGWTLVFVGGLIGFGWLALELSRAEMPLLPKVLVGLLIGGLTIVFLLTLRARLRTMPYDPYTEVER